jgi:hypothetical protein
MNASAATEATPRRYPRFPGAAALCRVPYGFHPGGRGARPTVFSFLSVALGSIAQSPNRGPAQGPYIVIPATPRSGGVQDRLCPSSKARPSASWLRGAAAHDRGPYGFHPGGRGARPTAFSFRSVALGLIAQSPTRGPAQVPYIVILATPRSGGVQDRLCPSSKARPNDSWFRGAAAPGRVPYGFHPGGRGARPTAFRFRAVALGLIAQSPIA